MYVLTADQIRQVENNCFDGYSTEAQLMLKAGTACYDAVMKNYGTDIFSKRIFVLCGNGKNAGDGFVMARLFYSEGIDVKIVLCDKKPTIPEPLEYFNQAVMSGVSVVDFDNVCLDDCDIIIDCIFGIGFKGEPRAPFDKVFNSVASCGSFVVSIDTPSGTDATSGKACKNAIKADMTVAISTLKYCHILPPSNALCGKTVTVNIGIPDTCYTPPYTETVELDYVRSSFPKIGFNANKGSNGRLLCLCGSYNMPGAAVICATAAVKSGAGLVKLTVPKSAYPIIASHFVQPVFRPVDDENGIYSLSALDDILSDVNEASAVVIGCGMGKNENTCEIVKSVLLNSKVPVIVDADGINSLLSCIDILKDVKAPVVLTPHPGEMARLVSKTIAEVQESRIDVAKEFARQYGIVLVLKGADTVITDGDAVFANLTGNASLAMGGTGDMLSGIIGSLLAQGLSPLDAAKAGVFIHGRCADEAVKELSFRGLTVFDLTDRLGALMSEYE